MVTEKRFVSDSQRDGGARVIEMLTSIESAKVRVLDFSVNGDVSKSSSWSIHSIMIVDLNVD